MALTTKEEIALYVHTRCKELDQLIAEQEQGSSHAYALTAGKFEILRMAVALGVKNYPTA